MRQLVGVTGIVVCACGGDPATKPDAPATPVQDAAVDAQQADAPQADARVPGPMVIAMTPAPAEVGVEPAALITATFSEPMDPSTLTQATFNVSGTSGSVSYDVPTRTATFVPATPLAFVGGYSVTITTGARSSSSIPLDAAATWSFTVRDGAWQAAAAISPTADFDIGPRVAADLTGAMVVWWRRASFAAGVVSSIWGSRYDAQTGWGPATLVELDDAGDATFPHVAFDGAGNALAAWQQSTGTRADIWSSRSATGGATWSSRVQVETNDTANAQLTDLHADRSGNAIATWQLGGVIWATRYVPGAGWGAAQSIQTGTGSSFADLDGNGTGNVVVAWAQNDGTRDNIWANRYQPATGWGTAELIETSAVSSNRVHVAVNAGGEAFAFWIQNDTASTSSGWVNRYVPGQGWGTATRIDTGTASVVGQPDIDADAAGNATAVWVQRDGTSFNAASVRYAAGVGWQTVTLLETGATDCFDPVVGHDLVGNAVVVWPQRDALATSSPTSLWYRRYVRGTGWTANALFETDATGSAFDPRVAIDDAGRAMVTWTRSDGTQTDTWARAFR